MELLEIFDKYSCDKGSLRHRYDRIYEPLLKPLKDQEITILEIGVLSGNSIKAWIEYFPKATIVCLDIFTKIPPEEISILNHPRVLWYVCDSTEGPSKEFISTAPTKFDLIIDDGLHTPNAQRQTFRNFIPFLKDNGVYFIEDVWLLDRMTNRERRHSWLRRYRTEFSDAKYEYLIKSLARYTMSIYDLRTGYHPDTSMIKITKPNGNINYDLNSSSR